MPVPPNPHLPPLLVLSFGLLVAAAIVAVHVAVARRDHRPVAAFLAGIAAAALARWVLLTYWVEPFQASYPGTPLTGSAFLAAHVESALFLAWPAGIAALAISIFLGRRALPVAGVWAVWALTSLALALVYPLTRGDVLRKCYLAAELAALVVAFGSIGMWARKREGVTLPRACVLLLVFFEFSTLLGPWIGDPFRDWDKAQILYSMLYAGLIALQGGALWLRSSSGSE